MTKQKRDGRRNIRRPKRSPYLSLHPLFFAAGVFYTLKGELFLFLLSFLVAVQHECAHAFAAARLGYKLNKIVLMPFGAMIDGDMRGLSLKDEIVIALWGPLCNFLTAAFFAALWWFSPTMYAFTDTAWYSSLSIALVNLLPAYPLDGGRILRCVLVKAFERKADRASFAEKTAERTTKIVTFCFALILLTVFFIGVGKGIYNVSLLTFSAFLFFGACSKKKNQAVYERIDLSSAPLLRRGAEVKRVALFADRPVKDTFRFLSRGYYYEFEIYDACEQRLMILSQNELSQCFALAKSPYEPIGELGLRWQAKRGMDNP